MFALSVFLTLRGISRAPSIESVPSSVLDYLDASLLYTRIGLGVLLLVVWPFAWQAAAYVANVEHKIYNDTLYQYGALLALATYAMLWLPWRWVIVALIAPILFSAVIAFLALAIPPRVAAAVWSVQIAAVLIASALLISLRHGPGIILDAPTIARRVANENEMAPYSSILSAPGDIYVTWTSTGSAWLDRRISGVDLSLTPGRSSRPLFLETIKPDRPPAYEQIHPEGFVSHMDAVIPEQSYTYRIHSRGEPVGVPFTLKGLLRPRVEMAPYRETPEGS